MNKYEDLAEAIHNDGIDAYWDEILAVLRWLDEHPDQVPGRTITESEYDDSAKKAKAASDIPDWNGRALLYHLGIKIVADPDPTNAEKLKAVLDAIGDSTAGYREHLASKLDDAGVKAPGGDDDH